MPLTPMLKIISRLNSNLVIANVSEVEVNSSSSGIVNRGKKTKSAR